MYELKTKETDSSVIEFIEGVDNLRKREDAYKLLDIFTDTTGYEAKMWGTSIIGFGKYHYKYQSGHEGDAPLVGFSPRKAKISLYFATGDTQRDKLLESFGKHTTGKACVYINKVADIDVDVLKTLIKQSVTFLKETYPEQGEYNMTKSNKKELSLEQREELLKALQARFEKNMHRHQGLEWAKIQEKLEANTEKLWALNEMEMTAGEPDVVDYDKKKDEYIFYDCSPESPKGRRSVCYDRQALESRKKHKPENSAIDMAATMGIELLTEEQYRALQTLESFDKKTSSWVQTPSDIRELGGALFCDYRFGHVFVYHNGADSYYAARGFRGSLRV